MLRILPDGEPTACVLEKLCTGAIWGEGPVWMPELGAIVWSDIPNNRMLRWSAQQGMSVFRAPSNFTNGNYRDAQGRLVSCSHGGRCIERTEADGTVTVLVERYQGKRLNSPNDLVVKSDGTIWFTDPPYGILSNHEGYQAPSELGDNYVFRFDPASATLDIVSALLEEPNGLAFSPDESLLYVADTSAALRSDGGGNHHIMVFDVVAGRTLGNPRLFAEVNPGLADGFRLDAHGCIYTSSADSIQVYHPDGTLLGKIHVPEKIANCTFGGPLRDELYIAASTSLYRIRLNTSGLQTT
ncbi:SMP-30/gluconolactonase/LRE family protein [Janthinobacterium sp. PC23-8]|uniref:SMP-30/gluconolactonase/LRE family protein n=1 Tax=Janthinobacterium sp. PC23-8 TaxID=2012679 RepID=UPI000B96ACCB|nr:SMP-30/gluconolactonase/LRE family protein [Janthinobacterium sp. PC23-8]OYO32613.1 gluconolactonase [Janthinobacterium sp. PC23-8]